MFSQYYQAELSRLRELAVEFAKAHPALAPLLSGPSQDPDVERLLEGTAFLTGMLREKLDDEFPEVIHGLMGLVFPHYLRPIPSTSIVVFTPKQSLMETISVPRGTTLDSVPVDGTKCTFRTCYDMHVHPLSLSSVRFQERSGRTAALTFRFALGGLDLKAFRTDHLRLHVTGDYAEAASIYHLFFENVTDVRLVGPNGVSFSLGPEAVRPVGLSQGQELLPYPPQSFPGYRILQEYFILPEKFLFFDVTGFDRWTQRGEGEQFDLVFELADLGLGGPTPRRDRFALFATPVVNIFPQEGDPINLDHRQPDYRVVPSGGQMDRYQVYSVEKVTGFAPGTVKKRSFVPFELFTAQSGADPVYHVHRKTSTTRSTSEVFLSVAYPPEAGPPQPETLSLELLCTNAALPENLKYGDINQPTSSSPELCSFSNILPPTPVVQPPLGKNLLWRFLSHMSLNLLSLADRNNLQALLRLYIFSESRERSLVLANEKRIQGIEDLSVESDNLLYYGQTLRGQTINLTLNPDNFPSEGDMYLFTMVLDHFLGTYASINCFTRLNVIDSAKGKTYRWPVRMGDRPLI
jgi:type VI secretion system protein ImpG